MNPIGIILLLIVAFGFCPAARATTWHVPSQCPTIQAGIDSASAGDTVLVGCGIYYEHDLLMKSGVCLKSQTGDPNGVATDAQEQGRVFHCQDNDSGELHILRERGGEHGRRRIRTYVESSTWSSLKAL